MDGFAAEGVRGYHIRMLAALDEFGPAFQADLGRETGIDRSDVVHPERPGRAWTRRAQPDPVDRRRNVITMTRRGVVALERLEAVLDDVQDALLARLTPNERTVLVRLLAKLI